MRLSYSLYCVLYPVAINIWLIIDITVSSIQYRTVALKGQIHSAYEWNPMRFLLSDSDLSDPLQAILIGLSDYV